MEQFLQNKTMLILRRKYVYLKSRLRLLSVFHYGLSHYDVTESASCSNGIFTCTRVIHALRPESFISRHVRLRTRETANANLLCLAQYSSAYN